MDSLVEIYLFSWHSNYYWCYFCMSILFLPVWPKSKAVCFLSWWYLQVKLCYTTKHFRLALLDRLFPDWGKAWPQFPVSNNYTSQQFLLGIASWLALFHLTLGLEGRVGSIHSTFFCCVWDNSSFFLEFLNCPSYPSKLILSAHNSKDKENCHFPFLLLLRGLLKPATWKCLISLAEYCFILYFTTCHIIPPQRYSCVWEC